jgi:hypothetical protein
VLQIFAFDERNSDRNISETALGPVSLPDVFRQMSLRLPVLTLDECRSFLMMPGACHLFTASKNDDSVGSIVEVSWPDLPPATKAMLLRPAEVREALNFWGKIEEAYQNAGGGFGPLERIPWEFLRVANQKGYSILIISQLQTVEYE